MIVVQEQEGLGNPSPDLALQHASIPTVIPGSLPLPELTAAANSNSYTFTVYINTGQDENKEHPIHQTAE